MDFGTDDQGRLKLAPPDTSVAEEQQRDVQQLLAELLEEVRAIRYGLEQIVGDSLMEE
jgi:hypothetical protein